VGSITPNPGKNLQKPTNKLLLAGNVAQHKTNQEKFLFLCRNFSHTSIQIKVDLK
jgi:hypothetical protein